MGREEKERAQREDGVTAASLTIVDWGKEQGELLSPQEHHSGLCSGQESE